MVFDNHVRATAGLWKDLAAYGKKAGYHVRPKGDGFELIRPDGTIAMIVTAGHSPLRMAEVIAAMKEAGIWEEGPQ